MQITGGRIETNPRDNIELIEFSSLEEKGRSRDEKILSFTSSTAVIFVSESL